MGYLTRALAVETGILLSSYACSFSQGLSVFDNIFSEQDKTAVQQQDPVPDRYQSQSILFDGLFSVPRAYSFQDSVQNQPSREDSVNMHLDSALNDPEIKQKIAKYGFEPRIEVADFNRTGRAYFDEFPGAGADWDRGVIYFDLNFPLTKQNIKNGINTLIRINYIGADYAENQRSIKNGWLTYITRKPEIRVLISKCDDVSIFVDQLSEKEEEDGAGYSCIDWKKRTIKLDLDIPNKEKMEGILMARLKEYIKR